jgi:hypothetical protein
MRSASAPSADISSTGVEWLWRNWVSTDNPSSPGSSMSISTTSKACAGSVQAFLAVLAPGHLKAAAAQMLVNIGTEHEVVFDGKDAGMASRRWES